jgi:hypothetical protein
VSLAHRRVLLGAVSTLPSVTSAHPPHPSAVRPPRVDAVGLVEHPAGYSSSPRAYPAGVRLAAALVIGVFLAVSVATTVYSLGGYCLTTYASAPVAVHVPRRP